MFTALAVTVVDEVDDELHGSAATWTVSPTARSLKEPAVVSVTVVDDVVVTVSEPLLVVTVKVPLELAVTSPKITGLVSVDELDELLDELELLDGAGTMAISAAARLPSEARVPLALT